MKSLSEIYNKHKSHFGEIIRFCIVGIIATVIHYGVYLLLKRYINISIAYSLGYIISFAVNFWLTNRFTFKTKATIKRGIGFSLSHVINYFLHIVILNTVLWIGANSDYAPILVFCIVIPINFLLVRKAIK